MKHSSLPLLQDDELGHKLKIDNDDSPDKSKDKASSPIDGSRKDVILYIVVFFFAMIGHEIALEAASTSFPQLESLAASVTLFQFGFCFLLPLITSRGAVLQTFPRTVGETFPYIRLSILVFGATGLATQSLRYVSYPTKVVFKSAKLIPTMIVATIVNPGKKYSCLEYFAALLLCLGAGGFSFDSGSGTSGDSDTSYYGIVLLTISILCDAVVPNLQQKLMSPSTTASLPSTVSYGGCGGLSAQAVMVNVNAVGFAVILVGMSITGSLVTAIQTSVVDPRLLLYLVCVGLGLSTAVLAYTKLIKASGSVVAVAVATLRKVATMMLSYILFPKPILRIHVFSSLLVLVGVLISTFCKGGRRNTK